MTAHFVQLLDELRRRSLRMASLVEDILHEACEAVFSEDHKLAERVITRDDEVDAEEVQIEGETIRIMALYQPVGSDLRLLCTILKVNNDLERVADCAVNIAERARHLQRSPVAAQCELAEEMAAIVRRMLRNAIHAYGMQDAAGGQSVVSEEHAVDALYGQMIRSVLADAAKHPDFLPSFLDALSIAKNLERIADHANNIAEDVVYLSTGQIVRHGSAGREPKAGK